MQANNLYTLEKFNYIYLIFFADRITREPEMLVSPPWAKGKRVGVFASRSPVRPNPVGLSIVRIKKIVGNKLYTSGLDVFDKTSNSRSIYMNKADTRFKSFTCI
jgi:tRNA (Thr-GGU) A37 N-methylase